ncbi:MAG: phosphatidylserine decarboxylase [Sulfurospirillum sp.]
MFKTSLISRLFGKFASTKFPSFIQIVINRSYVNLMKVDMSEFHKPSFYKSLNALFTRKLIKKREINLDKKSFISPSDSFITECGVIEEDRALQIKGFSYEVSSLLGDKIEKEQKEKLEDGYYINFYLSPKDYHRYHTPIDMQVIKAVHIPGKLYPVNLTWLQKIPSLFVENERVVLECKSESDGLFFMVFVGALNVGKMSFVFDKRIQTNCDKNYVTYYEYSDKFLKKAQELGKFEMGSTIVMFFEKDFVKLVAKEDKDIRFGENIATCQP